MLAKFIDRPREDSLTASVFTHLLHLPSELFWRLFSDACYTDKLPANPGEPLMVEGWPSWNAKHTTNSDRVIPDLFIRFAEFDLIVEAKRWDVGQQDTGQWQRELTAYTNEYGSECKSIRMIALGGLHGRKDAVIEHHWVGPPNDINAPDKAQAYLFTCPVHMCQWSGLLSQCQRLQKELEGLKYPSSHTKAWVRILKHVTEQFDCHGFSTGKWFADFNFGKHHLSTPSISCRDLLFKR